MTGNASIIVRIVENWNAFIILHVILDFLHFTTNVTPSVRPSQTYNPCVYVDAPLPYSLITNIATQLFGRNLLRNLCDILQTWDTEWFEQYSLSYWNVIYMHIFWFENIFITLRSDRYITSDHTFGGGSEVVKQPGVRFVT